MSFQTILYFSNRVFFVETKLIINTGSYGVLLGSSRYYCNHHKKRKTRKHEDGKRKNTKGKYEDENTKVRRRKRKDTMIIIDLKVFRGFGFRLRTFAFSSP